MPEVVFADGEEVSLAAYCYLFNRSSMLMNCFLRISALGAIMIAALLFSTSVHAAQHDIYFGGENNSPAFGYAPNTMEVNVGDTIVWHGDFAMHPLASFAVPDGAPAFSNSTGTTFQYVVMNSGSFRYRCLAHSTPDGQGMAGSFTTGTAGVHDPQRYVTSTIAVPNPVEHANTTMIHVQLAQRTHITLSVYDDKGNRVMTALDEDKDAGMQMLTLDVSTLPSGSYSYVVGTPDGVLRKGLIVAR